METYTVAVDSCGTKYWYQNDKLHRLDGPAVEHPNGYKEWRQNGLLHRIDGPAIESKNGTKHWYQNGKSHRLDGPACNWANGEKAWYIDDVEYTHEEFNKIAGAQPIVNTRPFLGQKIVIGGEEYTLS